MRFGVVLSWVFAFLFFIIRGGDCAERVLRVGDRAVIDFQQLASEVTTADLVFVGESHSELRHHNAQLRIIKALAATGRPVAVGLEMFRADSQKELDQWVDGGMSLGEFVKVYSENWGMPWPWYMKILTYAREAGIPLAGLNISDAITEKVSRTGYESLSREEVKKLPPGITFELDDRHRQHLKRIFTDHGKSEGTFDNFAKAQLVWDKTMAHHLMQFLKKNSGTTIVVLVGTDHAMKFGIPEQVRRQSAYRSKVILPEMPGRIERASVTAEDCDYLLLEW